MTVYEWVNIVALVSGEIATVVGGVFAWLWSENRRARDRAKAASEAADAKAKADLDTVTAALNAKMGLLEQSHGTSMYTLKKDVLEKVKEEKDILHERCKAIETAHQQNRTEFTAELREIVTTFTRTCDSLQTKLEHMTSTIIGQYVPRNEIDNRFSRLETKTDKVLDLLIEMKT